MKRHHLVYPITLANGEDAVKKIATLGAYQSDENQQILKYDIIINKDTTAGTYKIPIKYYFESEEKYSIEEVEIVVSTSDQIEIVSIDTTNLKPGEQKPINFRIKNVGTSTVNDLKFTWVSQDDAVLAVGGDNTYYVSKLSPGEIMDLPFEIFGDTTVSTGLYKLTTSIKYEDEVGIQEIISEAGIYIGGETDFAISFSSLNDGEISLDVANIGSNPAYSVLIKVPAQDGYKVSGSNTEMIGNLENGDYTVVSYEVTTKNSQKDLEVNIEYTDTRGIRQIVSKNVELNIDSNSMADGMVDGEMKNPRSSPMQGRKNPMSGMNTAVTKAKQFGTYAVVGIVLLGLGLFGYNKLKKSNKKIRSKK